MAPNEPIRRMAGVVGSGGLLALAGLHVAWAAGSSWPAPDDRSLARAIIGREEMPHPAGFAVVAGMLLTAAALVAGYPGGSSRLARLQPVGVGCVAGTLLLRGLAGAFGILPPQRTSQEFARWDGRLYTPLCFALAMLCYYGGRRSA